MAVLITACDNNGDGEQAQLQDTGQLMQTDDNTREYTYQCENGQSVQVKYEPRFEQIILFMTERAVRLDREVSASGAKYRSGNLTFWMKDNEARLQNGNNAAVTCSRKPDADN